MMKRKKVVSSINIEHGHQANVRDAEVVLLNVYWVMNNETQKGLYVHA